MHNKYDVRMLTSRPPPEVDSQMKREEFISHEQPPVLGLKNANAPLARKICFASPIR